jgi:hypothetical protein
MGDELHIVEGQPTYHILHLPLEFDDGVVTGKGEWPADLLVALTTSRLAAASETHWEGPSHKREITAPDRDAQFAGVVLPAAPAHPAGKDHPHSLRLNLALIFGYCDFAQTRFSGDAWFQRAAFSGAARFQGAAFSGDAWFFTSTFAQNAYFSGARFEGDIVLSTVAPQMLYSVVRQSTETPGRVLF